MNSIINYLLESMSLGQFALAFILVAVVVNALLAVAIVEAYVRIRYWNVNRKLAKLDEFEYRNDLY